MASARIKILSNNETNDIFWNFEIQTDHLMLDRRPHFVIIYKKKKEKKRKKRELSG